MRRYLYMWWLTACLLMITGCRQQEYMEQRNAVYYWRTTLRLSAAERQFLDDYKIEKVYCRYFDVVMDDYMQMPRPNATIAFGSDERQLPAHVEIVPTVYITEDCMHQRHDSLAARLVGRILQMNETHGIEHVRELQMDCDYTSRSRQNYYDFLEEVRRLADEHGLTLSATIRLHQLQMAPPPVDYGVLMLYNTGDPRRFEERNPILDIRDVQPYAEHLPHYKLPLAAAYPVYRWIRDVQGVRIEHTVEADEILEVKALAERKRPELRQTIITYHLDEENIDRYKPETYEAIYHH
ncbi:MAG: hypothetical protein K6A96_03205 [Prevotella sp.]|nr:hypothetical protein [Prevotella sp.]